MWRSRRQIELELMNYSTAQENLGLRCSAITWGKKADSQMNVRWSWLQTVLADKSTCNSTFMLRRGSFAGRTNYDRCWCASNSLRRCPWSILRSVKSNEWVRSVHHNISSLKLVVLSAILQLAVILATYSWAITLTEDTTPSNAFSTSGLSR